MSQPIALDTILAAQAGDSDAMWDVVAAVDPIILSLIRELAPREASTETRESAHQEARAALLEALRDYRTDGARLTTWVYPTLRRAVASELTRCGVPVAIEPEIAREVRKALADCAGDYAAAFLLLSGVSAHRFAAVVDAMRPAAGWDSPVGGDEGLTLADVTPDPEAHDIDIERRDYARWLLTQIPPRQSLALRAHFGVQMSAQDDAQTMFEMGLTRAALLKLRSNGYKSARDRASESISLAA